MSKFQDINNRIKEVVGKEGFKKYFKNTSWLFIEKIIIMGISFVVGALVARYLDTDEMGLLSFSQSLVGFLYIFSELGLNNVLTRDLVTNPEERDGLLGVVQSFFECWAHYFHGY